MNKKEYLILKKLIDRECNRSIIKPEWKEPIIFVHKILKESLKNLYKYQKKEFKK